VFLQRVMRFSVITSIIACVITGVPLLAQRKTTSTYSPPPAKSAPPQQQQNRNAPAARPAYAPPANNGARPNPNYNPNANRPNTYNPNTYNPNARQPNTYPPNRPAPNTPANFGNRPSGQPANLSRGPNGLSTYRGPNNTTAQFRPNGKIQELHANGINITHVPGASSRIVTQGPNHSIIVTNATGHGYVQRQFTHNNQVYVQRTYYVNGVSYARVYHQYYYHGVYLQTYVPVRYYAPAFYGWAYAPWPRAVVYPWGWGYSPWYVYYGPYFTPYPVYPSASLWLTDYLISQSLADAYQARQDAAADPQADPPAYGASYTGQPLTPEAKQAIADEVQRQLAEEKNEAQLAAQQPSADQQASGLAQEFSGAGPWAFVVASNLDTNTVAGQGCVVTEGDVLQLNAPPPSNSAGANVEVLSSQGHDCAQGTVITVSLEALQDMQNHMRESIDQGLQTVQTHQNGLPAPPASTAGQVQTGLASAAPAPDQNAPAELSQAAQQANQTEQQVITQANSSGGTATASSPQPVTIGLGQTIAQVIASLGPPKRIANLGSKQIYVYNDMKITFVNGKVTDVE
jgi:hypothetical protein